MRIAAQRCLTALICVTFVHLDLAAMRRARPKIRRAVPRRDHAAGAGSRDGDVNVSISRTWRLTSGGRRFPGRLNSRASPAPGSRSASPRRRSRRPTRSPTRAHYASRWWPCTGSPTATTTSHTLTAEAIYEVTITRRTLEPGAGEHARSPSHSGRAVCDSWRPRPISTFRVPGSRHGFARRSCGGRPAERDLDFAHRAMETLVRTHTYRARAQVEPLGVGRVPLRAGPTVEGSRRSMSASCGPTASPRGA